MVGASSCRPELGDRRRALGSQLQQGHKATAQNGARTTGRRGRRATSRPSDLLSHYVVGGFCGGGRSTHQGVSRLDMICSALSDPSIVHYHVFFRAGTFPHHLRR